MPKRSCSSSSLFNFEELETKNSNPLPSPNNESKVGIAGSIQIPENLTKLIEQHTNLVFSQLEQIDLDYGRELEHKAIKAILEKLYIDKDNLNVGEKQHYSKNTTRISHSFTVEKMPDNKLRVYIWDNAKNKNYAVFYETGGMKLVKTNAVELTINNDFSEVKAQQVVTVSAFKNDEKVYKDIKKLKLLFQSETNFTPFTFTNSKGSVTKYIMPYKGRDLYFHLTNHNSFSVDEWREIATKIIDTCDTKNYDSKLENILLRYKDGTLDFTRIDTTDVNVTFCTSKFNKQSFQNNKRMLNRVEEKIKQTLFTELLILYIMYTNSTIPGKIALTDLDPLPQSLELEESPVSDLLQSAYKETLHENKLFIDADGNFDLEKFKSHVKEIIQKNDFTKLSDK